MGDLSLSNQLGGLQMIWVYCDFLRIMNGTAGAGERRKFIDRVQEYALQE